MSWSPAQGNALSRLPFCELVRDAVQFYAQPSGGGPGMIVSELLTTAEAARLLNIGERTLWRHSRSGAAPAPVTIGGAVRYRRSEILDRIAAGCPRVNGGAKP